MSARTRPTWRGHLRRRAVTHPFAPPNSLDRVGTNRTTRRMRLSIRIAAIRSSQPTFLRAPRAAHRLGGSLVAVALLAGAGAGSARAADDEVWIKYRQTVMSSIGGNMGGIGDILKNGLPITSNIEFHASAIATESRLIASAFEQKVVDGATDAEAEIWSDPDGFAKATESMREAAEQLSAAIAEGNNDLIGPRVKALGKACGSCHKSFRKPKEESYKNK